MPGIALFIEVLRVTERFERVRIGHWIYTRDAETGDGWWQWIKSGRVEMCGRVPCDSCSSLGVSEVGIHDTVPHEKR